MVAIMGGLTSCDDLNDAGNLVKTKLGPELNKIYIKSDIFKGLIFVKFRPARRHDMAIHRIRAGTFQYGEHILWADEDNEIQDRADRDYYLD